VEPSLSVVVSRTIFGSSVVAHNPPLLSPMNGHWVFSIALAEAMSLLVLLLVAVVVRGSF